MWAYSLRNPQRSSRELGGQGRMFIDDIGQNQIEEVDLGVKWANYGWQQREGTFATGTGAGSSGKDDYSTTPFRMMPPTASPTRSRSTTTATMRGMAERCRPPSAAASSTGDRWRRSNAGPPTRPWTNR